MKPEAILNIRTASRLAGEAELVLIVASPLVAWENVARHALATPGMGEQSVRGDENALARGIVQPPPEKRTEESKYYEFPKRLNMVSCVAPIWKERCLIYKRHRDPAILNPDRRQ
jgi:hypothetical protein